VRLIPPGLLERNNRGWQLRTIERGCGSTSSDHHGAAGHVEDAVSLLIECAAWSEVAAIVDGLEARPVEMRFEAEPVAIPRNRPRLFAADAPSEVADELAAEACGRLEAALTVLEEALLRPDPNRVYWFSQVSRAENLLLRAAPINVGTLLRGVKREDVVRGQVLAKPGSITPHTQFNAQVYVLTKEEGGRHTPFLSGYRPQFYMRTTDVTGEVKLPEGVEMTMPGDNVVMEITLGEPIGIEPGLRFAIREGGKTVGAGVVTEVIK